MYVFHGPEKQISDARPTSGFDMWKISKHNGIDKQLEFLIFTAYGVVINPISKGGFIMKKNRSVRRIPSK